MKNGKLYWLPSVDVKPQVQQQGTMKTKIIIATALLTVGLGLGASSTTANAASWHKGVPKVMRHTKWRRVNGDRVIFGGTYFYTRYAKESNDPYTPIKNRYGLNEVSVHYKVLKHHLYKLRYEESSSYYEKFSSYWKYSSAHKLIYKGSKHAYMMVYYRYF